MKQKYISSIPRSLWVRFKRDKEESLLVDLKEIFNNSTLSAGTQMINLGINLVIVILLARFLGPAAMGQYALGISLSGIIFGFVNLGLQGILLREVAQNSALAGKYLGNSLGIRLLFSMPVGIALCYCCALVLRMQHQTLNVVILAAVYIGLSGFVTLFYSLFQAVGRFRAQFILNSFYKLGSLCGCIALLLTGKTMISILILFIIGQCLVIILSSLIVDRRVCPVRVYADRSFWIIFVRQAFPLSLAGTAEFITMKSDAVLLGSFKGEDATGIYNAAYNIYLGATALPYAIIMAFYPTFSRAYALSKQQAKKVFQNTFILLLVICSILALIIAVFAKPIVGLLYGVEFMGSVLPLVILALGFPFIMLNRLNNYTLVAMGLQKWTFYIIMSAAVLNVVANLIVIPVYSYVGASITTVITEALVFFAGIIRIHVNFQCDRNDLQLNEGVS